MLTIVASRLYRESWRVAFNEGVLGDNVRASINRFLAHCAGVKNKRLETAMTKIIKGDSHTNEKGDSSQCTNNAEQKIRTIIHSGIKRLKKEFAILFSESVVSEIFTEAIFPLALSIRSINNIARSEERDINIKYGTVSNIVKIPMLITNRNMEKRNSSILNPDNTVLNIRSALSGPSFILSSISIAELFLYILASKESFSVLNAIAFNKSRIAGGARSNKKKGFGRDAIEIYRKYTPMIMISRRKNPIKVERNPNALTGSSNVCCFPETSVSGRLLKMTKTHRRARVIAPENLFVSRSINAISSRNRDRAIISIFNSHIKARMNNLVSMEGV